MSVRSVNVHRELVGKPRDGKQDVITISVRHHKGAGYVLDGRVQGEEDGCVSFLMFTGIEARAPLLPAKRLSAAKLKTLAKDMRGNETLSKMVETIKAELARRIAAGEDY